MPKQQPLASQNPKKNIRFFSKTEINLLQIEEKKRKEIDELSFFALRKITFE